MHRIKFARPWIGIPERRAVSEALGQDTLTNGPQVKAFETEFAEWCGGGFAVAVSSCMAALHICHMILNWKKCHISPLTHVAAWHAADLTNCKPGAQHPMSIVHFLGYPYDALGESIEDCALAMGSRYVDGMHVGLRGEAGCFSFYPCKHMTTGEGGMILTKHEHLALEARKIRHFGQCPRGTFRNGLNYRMTEMQAALGREQLKRMHWFLERRTENAKTLDKILRPWAMFEDLSTYAYALRLKDRGEVRSRLLRLGIETSVYYHPIPPLTPYYRKKYGYKEGDFPEAEEISNTILCLPVGPHVTPGECNWLAETVGKVLEECESVSSGEPASSATISPSP